MQKHTQWKTGSLMISIKHVLRRFGNIQEIRLHYSSSSSLSEKHAKMHQVAFSLTPGTVKSLLCIETPD